MSGKIWEAVTGPWGLAAVLLLAIPDGRKALKSVTKNAIRAGFVISEGAKDLIAEVKEEANEMVVEVKAERKHSEKHASQKS